MLKPLAAQAFDFIPWTPVFNITGMPAMSVPLWWNAQGLPVGVHFAAPFGDDATLFRLAAQLEEARSWHDRRPPLIRRHESE
jgi:amidase